MGIFFVILVSISAIDDNFLMINDQESTNCSQDLVFEDFCYNECPNGYEQQDKSCFKKKSLLFDFKFFSDIDSFYEENLICETYHQLPPVPTEKRGLFFGSTSNICTTKAQFLFGPKLLIVL